MLPASQRERAQKSLSAPLVILMYADSSDHDHQRRHRNVVLAALPDIE